MEFTTGGGRRLGTKMFPGHGRDISAVVGGEADPGSPAWEADPGSPAWEADPGSPAWEADPGSPAWEAAIEYRTLARLLRPSIYRDKNR